MVDASINKLLFSFIMLNKLKNIISFIGLNLIKQNIENIHVIISEFIIRNGEYLQGLALLHVR